MIYSNVISEKYHHEVRIYRDGEYIASKNFGSKLSAESFARIVDNSTKLSITDGRIVLQK